MPDNTVTRFFLGANSALGFYSLYDDFAKPQDGVFLHVLKGGPGCGKSSFMKRIGKAAEGAGLDVEYIHCSGDPDSLDGVYIPALRTAYADGTAPHVLDPIYPGAGGSYLDLGAFYDSSALRGRLDELSLLNKSYKDGYAKAYRLLRAAGSVSLSPAPELLTDGIAAAVRRRAAGMAARELGRGSGSGRVTRRFISAITCKGDIFAADTVTALCPRLCELDNELGFAQLYLDELAARAGAAGFDIILCPDCLTPEKIRALLIPEKGIAFAACARRTPRFEAPYRHIRLDALADTETLRRLRPSLRTAEKLRAALISEAEEALLQAKSLHDVLEQLYNPYVDFEGVYSLCRRHLDALGLSEN